jgi:tRNA C32,U32 (ribose-2'-O)-methylase TrmJ
LGAIYPAKGGGHILKDAKRIRALAKMLSDTDSAKATPHHRYQFISIKSLPVGRRNFSLTHDFVIP